MKILIDEDIEDPGGHLPLSGQTKEDGNHPVLSHNLNQNYKKDVCGGMSMNINVKENIAGQATLDPYGDSKPMVKFDERAWGLLTSLDVEDCDPDIIRDADAIKRYVIELCDLIEMKRFGECHVVHFGEDDRVAGYSMFQLIETSCISGHFANATNRSYIDIFSCKAYDPEVVKEFTQKFFKGGTTRTNVVNRY